MYTTGSVYHQSVLKVDLDYPKIMGGTAAENTVQTL